MEETEMNRSFQLRDFKGVSKFKSIWRAIRRGLVREDGTVYPSRPFNNRKPTKGREMNESKKQIYGEYKRYLDRV